jgi:hypothetical protein
MSDPVKIALISADLGKFRNNLTSEYVKQELPEGWTLDIHFFDDANFPGRPSLSPRLQAKIPKMLGYELLPGYDFYIWLDSSFALSHKNAVVWFVESCQNADIAVFKHPYRNTICEEVKYIVSSMEAGDEYLIERYKDEPIREQVDLYCSDRDYSANSLYALGAFIYRKELLNQPGKNILPLWFYHNSRYSIQDQLSFPYLADRLTSSKGLKVAEFSDGIFSNRYIRFSDRATGGADSNVGKWDNWYSDISSTPSAFRYSDTVTYEMGCDFLSDCPVVEDWGTGAGGFKRFRPDAIGVDGSNTPHADKKYVDLVTYTSSCDAVFMRHVLEHNYNWTSVLRNALQSATKKVCVVVFTPFNEKGSKEIAHNKMHGVDVPDMSLGIDEFTSILDESKLKSIRMERVESATGYGVEHVVYIEKQ